MPSSNKQPLALRIRRSEADQRLERHIEEALALLTTPGDTHIMDWFHAKERWVALTSRALKTAFTSAEAAESFEGVAQPHYYARLDRTITQRREDERGQIRDGINRLRSLQEQLQYLDEPSVSAPPAPTAAGELAPAPIDAGRIFVVHGRDTERKLHVARVLERTGNHEVVILHEQSNEGRTLIEKFEKTCDSRRLRGHPAHGGRCRRLATRIARLNARAQPARSAGVVFELGFFVGLLGRSRVSILYEDGVELPSDIAGLVYTAIDPAGAWEFALLKELKNIGLTFDLEQARRLTLPSRADR